MISYDDFKKLDIRIAEIVEVKPHSNADRLYVIKVDKGGETCQVVAGIRPSYKEEELIGKKVVLLANLEPAVIRGEESNGMILCASAESGPIILVPQKDVPIGTIVK